MRLGGGPSILDPFAEKPPRMHRQTYYRLLGRAMAAQEHSLGLERDYLRRHFPGVLRTRTSSEASLDRGGR